MSEITTPIGARVFVECDAVVVEEEARARSAGLYIVVDKKNIPRPTSGIIIAVGTDPLIQELFEVGDRVTFGKYGGTDIILNGKPYRSLEMSDIHSRTRKSLDHSESLQGQTAELQPPEPQQPEPRLQHSPSTAPEAPAQQLLDPELLG